MNRDTQASSPSRLEDLSLVGAYEVVSGRGSEAVAMLVTITQSGEEPEITFQAAHVDGHGAAPDGSGTGRVGNDGVFRFSFSDSFNNEGAGTFRRAGGRFALSMKLQEVAEPRCLPFYRDFILHRVEPPKEENTTSRRAAHKAKVTPKSQRKR